MKLFKSDSNTSKLEKILLSLILIILILILVGTIIGFASKKAVPGKNLRKSDPLPTEKEIENLNKHSDSKIAAYTGLGTIRTVTAPDESKENDSGVAVVITPWLSYPEGDTVFFEELSRKRLLIKGIISSYFSNYTQNQLLIRTEENIKEDLMILINEQLNLGKISNIYFTDYIFIQ